MLENAWKKQTSLNNESNLSTLNAFLKLTTLQPVSHCAHWVLVITKGKLHVKHSLLRYVYV